MDIEALRGVISTQPVKRDKKEKERRKKKAVSGKKRSQKKTGKVDVKV